MGTFFGHFPLLEYKMAGLFLRVQKITAALEIDLLVMLTFIKAVAKQLYAVVKSGT